MGAGRVIGEGSVVYFESEFECGECCAMHICGILTGEWHESAETSPLLTDLFHDSVETLGI